MILEVRHETQLEYSLSVSESLAEVRVEPVSDDNQSVRSFHLTITPYAEAFRYTDGFGNRVHHFNMLHGVTEIRVVAASIVETHPRAIDLATSRATYPIDEQTIELRARSFMALDGPVSRSELLSPLLTELQPQPGMLIGDILQRVATYICEHYEYAKDVTLASSPIDHVLREGKGVCQDFTHLMIAILRSFGIPARYVSGYVHRPNKESQSHAWCEVWVPDLGWHGIDPTNNRFIDEHFVKVAVGRDFTDVPPNKGVYRGKSEENINVRVESRSLDRLPSLTWQESLPSFEKPLTPIAYRSSGQEGDYHGSQQQQQ